MVVVGLPSPAVGRSRDGMGRTQREGGGAAGGSEGNRGPIPPLQPPIAVWRARAGTKRTEPPEPLTRPNRFQSDDLPGG